MLAVEHRSPHCGFPATGSRNVSTHCCGGTTYRNDGCRCELATRLLEIIGPFMKRQLQKSLNLKRPVRIGRHKTSVSLEDAFWKDIQEIAAIRKVSLPDLLAAIDTGRHFGGLSSAIRLFVLEHYRGRIGARKSAERHTDEKGRSSHRAAPRP
jgi:predicted DNA-binding ribbon-helix-helix protein